MKKEYLYHGIGFVIWVTLNVNTVVIPAPVTPNKDGSINAVMAWQSASQHHLTLEIDKKVIYSTEAFTDNLKLTVQLLEEKAESQIDNLDPQKP